MLKKNFGRKKFLLKKKIFSQKKICQKKFLVGKNFLIHKIFWVKKIFALKKFFGWKWILVKKNFGAILTTCSLPRTTSPPYPALPHLTSPHLNSPIPKPPHQPSIVLETMKNQKKTWFGWKTHFAWIVWIIHPVESFTPVNDLHR